MTFHGATCYLCLIPCVSVLLHTHADVLVVQSACMYACIGMLLVFVFHILPAGNDLIAGALPGTNWQHAHTSPRPRDVCEWLCYELTVPKST